MTQVASSKWCAHGPRALRALSPSSTFSFSKALWADNKDGADSVSSRVNLTKCLNVDPWRFFFFFFLLGFSLGAFPFGSFLFFFFFFFCVIAIQFILRATSAWAESPEQGRPKLPSRYTSVPISSEPTVLLVARSFVYICQFFLSPPPDTKIYTCLIMAPAC